MIDRGQSTRATRATRTAAVSRNIIVATQRVNRILFKGPARGDETAAVITAQLSCGCVLTTTVHEARIVVGEDRSLSFRGDLECPQGHERPSWLHDNARFIVRAVERARKARERDSAVG